MEAQKLLFLTLLNGAHDVGSTRLRLKVTSNSSTTSGFTFNVYPLRFQRLGEVLLGNSHHIAQIGIDELVASLFVSLTHEEP